MDTVAIVTMIKMFESLPDQFQETVVEHMREYIEDIREETKWKETFSRTEDKLIVAARKARQEITEGKASPLDIDQL